MERDLRRIAKHGRAIMGRGWMGFDDADISWFLSRHREIDGRMLRAMRRDMLEIQKSTRFDVLYYWPFTKTQAKAILREIKK